MAHRLEVLSLWWWLWLSLQTRIAYALFIQPPSTVKPYPTLRLGVADKLRIPYVGLAYDAGKAASLPSFALSLDADFGQISFDAFKDLRKAYGFWSETKTRVQWFPDQSYKLSDFLPPLLQATNGLFFQSSRSPQTLPSFVGDVTDVQLRQEQEVLLACNCWGFAWEVLFQADNKDVRQMTVSTADPSSAWQAFTNRQNFSPVQSSQSDVGILDPERVRLRNRKLQPGDVLLIWHKLPKSSIASNAKSVSSSMMDSMMMYHDDLYLDHVAIVLDQDLYFEKSGSGDNTPFRITTWEGLTANWPTSIFEWEWRRLRRNNLLAANRGAPLRPKRKLSSTLTKLPAAADTFGLDSTLTTLSDMVQDRRFFVLQELRPSVAKLLSLTTEVSADGGVEGHTYTGIWVLEDLVFDNVTGRAKLPPSAFTAGYMKLPRLPSNPFV